MNANYRIYGNRLVGIGCTRTSEDRGIEGIERLNPALQLRGFPDIELLLQRECRLRSVRIAQRALPRHDSPGNLGVIRQRRIAARGLVVDLLAETSVRWSEAVVALRRIVGRR